MLRLRQSTAATVEFGPFVGTDALTESTALSSQTGRVVKNGTSSSLTPSSWSHVANGNYAVGLSTSHTDTVGRLQVMFQSAASYLPVWKEFDVISAAVYDVDFGSTAPSTYAGGAVASVTGAVGSVTGNVGGSVASVTGNVGGNVTGTVASVVGSVGSVTGAVGSVTGAVGSVTGNVGGNVTGSVGSVTGNVGGNVTGTVTLAASQANYAPAKAGDAMTLTGAYDAAKTAAASSALASLVATVGVAGAGLTAVTAASVGDKTGYKLASDGLDAIDTTEPTISGDGAFSTWNFRKLLRWAIMRDTKADRTPTALATKTLANATSTSQAVSDDGAGTESIGAPS